MDAVERQLRGLVAADAEFALDGPGHLAATGQEAEFQKVLSDPAFIAAKAWRRGRELPGDMALAAEREALRPLARSVRLAQPLLARCRRFDDLAATLWSRLAFDPSPAVADAAAAHRPAPGALFEAAPPPDLPDEALVLDHQLQGLTPGAVALDAGGTRVAAGCNGQAIVWDAAGGVVAEYALHRSPIQSIALSDDGDVVATSSSDGDVAVTRLSEPRTRRLRPRPFALSPDGRLLAVETRSGAFRLEGVVSGSGVVVLPPGAASAPTRRGLVVHGGLAAAVSAYAAGGHESVHAVEAASGLIRAFTVCSHQSGGWEALAWAVVPMGPLEGLRRPATTGPLLVDDRVWERCTDLVDADMAVALIAGDPSVSVYATVAEDDGRGARVRSARLRDARSGELLVDLQDRFHVVSAALDRTGTRLATATTRGNPEENPGGRVRVYDIPTLVRARRTLPDTTKVSVGAVGPHPSHPSCYYATLDGTLRRARVADLSEEWAVQTRAPRSSAIAVSPDGRLVASGSHSKVLLVHDTRSGERVVGVDTRPAPVHACRFASPRQILVALGTGMAPYPFLNGVRLFSALDGETIAKRDDFSGAVVDVALAGVGEFALALTEDGELRCMRIADLDTVWITSSESFTGMSVCGPDPVVTGHGNGTIELRSLAEGQLVACRRAHAGPVTSLDRSPCGVLVSGSEDGTVSVWGSNAEEPDATIQLTSAVRGCRWHGDRNVLAGTDAGLHRLRLGVLEDAMIADQFSSPRHHPPAVKSA